MSVTAAHWPWGGFHGAGESDLPASRDQAPECVVGQIAKRWQFELVSRRYWSCGRKSAERRCHQKIPTTMKLLGQRLCTWRSLARPFRRRSAAQRRYTIGEDRCQKSLG